MRQLTPPVEDFRITREPFYVPQADEVEIFSTAWNTQVPVLLKGPTGSGKTRFVSYMAYKLGRPLVTVACHDDLSSSDLLGRFLLEGDETIWVDGPLTAGVRHGAIVYL
ncbi:MAG TPA: AAA family ATPase, partial [Myxococcota bacterium]|nr:AAA family ATPase [Myxococcota bacterium]